MLTMGVPQIVFFFETIYMGVLQYIGLTERSLYPGT